jgi:hypothetical protein
MPDVGQRAAADSVGIAGSSFAAILVFPERAKCVFTMNRVGKTVPPKRQTLKDISSFFGYVRISPR